MAIVFTLYMEEFIMKPGEKSETILKHFDDNGNVEVEMKDTGDIYIHNQWVACIPKLAKALKNLQKVKQ